MGDDHAAQPGAGGVAEIEGGDVEGRGEALSGAFGLFQHPHLQRRHGGEGGGAEQADIEDGRDLAVDGEGHGGQHQRQHDEAAEHGRHQPAVGSLAADADCRQ